MAAKHKVESMVLSAALRESGWPEEIAAICGSVFVYRVRKKGSIGKGVFSEKSMF